MKPRIPIARPDIGRQEHLNVNEAMRTKWITHGPFVKEAEERLCKITGRKYALCTSSGTAALIAALLVTDYGNRPRIVAVPALTFAAVHNAVRLTGGPLWQFCFQDADWKSWAVPDVASMGYSFTDAIAAPCYGKVAIDRNLFYATKGTVIEDAAESFGGYVDGRPAGSFGLISCISFYANKICTAGEGGAVLTNDIDIHLRLKATINHGITGKDYVSHVIGFNGRMTDLQAAVLCAQLERMPRMIKRRREIWTEFAAITGGRWKFPTVEPGEVMAPWLFAGIPYNRDAIIVACERENIEWRPFFPIPDEALHVPNARALSAQGLCLPLSSALTDEEVERICGVIRG